MNILTINAGSSSIKYKVYQDDKTVMSGLIEGIGEKSAQWHHHYHEKTSKQQIFLNHHQAFQALAELLKADLINYPISGVGHRVVHGGEHLYNPTVINDAVLQDIENLANLAPIHNPVNAEGIRFARHHFPNALQVAVFDSGFHHNMPTYVRRYAINESVAEKHQIRRYGFHGINHEFVARKAAEFLNKPFADCQFISLHLGNGASACLIKNGISQDTSMGMTPLAGLVMGTRCGDIDPAIPLYLCRQGMSVQEVDNLLNKQSGLFGIANDNDMRHLLEREKQGDAQADLAIRTYLYSIQKMIGSYLSQTTHLDALIFTGGVGENAASIRKRILMPLAHMGFHIDNQLNEQSGSNCWLISTAKSTPVLVIRGDEESLIASKVAEMLNADTR